MEWAWTQKEPSAKDEAWRSAIIIDYFAGLGVTRLDEITRYQVEQMRIWLRTRTVQVYDKRLKKKAPKAFRRSPATINRYTQLLRGMIYKAAEWGMFSGINPVRKMKPYIENPGVRDFSPEALEAVLPAVAEISVNPDPDSPVQPRLADLTTLALNAGLRRAEMLKLRWRDWTGDEVHVNGKGNKDRTVPLNAAAREAIEKQPRRGEYIFDIPNRFQRGLMRRTYNRVSAKAGLRFTLHRCRHTFASELLRRGVDIVTISELMGHSKAMTTLLYAHTSPAQKKSAVDKLDPPGPVGTKRGHRHTDVDGKKGKNIPSK